MLFRNRTAAYICKLRNPPKNLRGILFVGKPADTRAEGEIKVLIKLFQKLAEPQSIEKPAEN